MTAAQRATLEDLAQTYALKPGHGMRVYDALRAALGTCGNCAHAADRVSVADRYTFCSAPNDPSRFPFLHKQMPMGERCNGWEPWKDDDA